MSSYQQSTFNNRQLKDKIQASFSKAAINYDTLALFQKEVAEELIDFGFRISDFGFKTLYPSSATKGHLPYPGILDIGCGTGFLTHSLAKLLPKANIFGCDIAHEMIDVTKDKGQGAGGKKIHLLTADGAALPYRDKAFGMVASNLTYQWIHDINTAFSEAYRVLRPGGIYIFSTLGPETLKELRYCYAKASAKFNKDGLPAFMDFSEKQAIQSALKNAGLKNISIEIAKMIKTYPDMWTLLKTMKSIGAGNPFKNGDKSLGRGSLLKKMAAVYEEKFGVRSSELGVNPPHSTSHILHPGYIYATYEVMFVKAVKLG
jgi:malonyl-CoA O-methyltransferase